MFEDQTLLAAFETNTQEKREKKHSVIMFFIYLYVNVLGAKRD